MLIQRLAVAAIGLPLLALTLWAPERVFLAVLAVALAVGAFELTRAAFPDLDVAYPLSAASMTALVVALARTFDEFPVWPMLAPTAAALAFMLYRGGQMRAPVIGWWLGAVLYLGVLGAHIALTRNLEDGVRWLVVLLAATFATDTGAYAVGRLFGRRPLVPRISPKKTVEGAAGGLLFGALATVVAAYLLDVSMAGGGILLAAVALPVAAQAGDILESALKRRIGVKDASGLLPGHGGILDRLDSLLLTGALLYWLLRWLQA